MNSESGEISTKETLQMYRAPFSADTDACAPRQRAPSGVTSEMYFPGPGADTDGGGGRAGAQLQ